MNARVVVLSILVLAGIGFVVWQYSEPGFTVHAKPSEAVDPEPVDFAATIETDLAAGRYDELDAMEMRYRAVDVRFIGGISKITRFYEVLAAFTRPPGAANIGPCTCTGSLVVTPSFTEAEARLESWHKARPKSIAAPVALANIWLASALEARGEDFFGKVSAAQWDAVRQRLAQAEYYLIDTDETADPLVYETEMRIGELRWSGRPGLDTLYHRAITRFPRYYPYYAQRAHELQEKWFGASDELPGYLSDLRATGPSDAGDVAYSFAAFRLMVEVRRDELFKDTGLDFAAVIKAYQTRERLYGLRDRDWNAIFNLSIEGRDCETAHVALLQLGDRWDPEVWGSRGYFDQTVAWFHANSKY